MVFYSVMLAAVVVTLALRGSPIVRAVAVPFIDDAMISTFEEDMLNV